MSPADEHAQAASVEQTLATALDRLRALGNPGAVEVPRGFLRRAAVGWAVPALDPGAPVVHVLASGEVLLDGHHRRAAALDAATRRRLEHWAQRLQRTT